MSIFEVWLLESVRGRSPTTEPEPSGFDEAAQLDLFESLLVFKQALKWASLHIWMIDGSCLSAFDTISGLCVVEVVTSACLALRVYNNFLTSRVLCKKLWYSRSFLGGGRWTKIWLGNGNSGLQAWRVKTSPEMHAPYQLAVQALNAILSPSFDGQRSLETIHHWWKQEYILSAHISQGQSIIIIRRTARFSLLWVLDHLNVTGDLFAIALYACSAVDIVSYELIPSKWAFAFGCQGKKFGTAETWDGADS